MGAWFRWIKIIYGKMGRAGTVDYTGIKVTRPSTPIPVNAFSNDTLIYQRLFAITGGPVQIHKIVGVITVALANCGEHRMRKLCQGYGRAGGDDMGKWSNAQNKKVNDILTPYSSVTDGNGKCGGLGGGAILAVGSIYWGQRDENGTGSIKWMAWYTPLVEGARLVAAEGDYLDNAEVEAGGSPV